MALHLYGSITIVRTNNIPRIYTNVITRVPEPTTMLNSHAQSTQTRTMESISMENE